MNLLPMDVSEPLDIISSGLATISSFDEPTAAGGSEVADLQQKIEQLKQYAAKLTSRNSIGAITLDVLQELVDDEIYNLVFEMHRAYKLKILADPTKIVLGTHTSIGLVDIPGYDIFGIKAKTEKNVQSFKCPNCGTLRQPAKFAPHLEKCMGMGGRDLRRGATRGSSNNSETGTSKRKSEARATSPTKKQKGIDRQALLKQQAALQQQLSGEALVEQDALKDLMMFEVSATDGASFNDLWNT